MDKRTKRIIGIFIVLMFGLFTFVYGYILQSSSIKGIEGTAYKIEIRDDSLLFLSEFSSSVKLDEINHVAWIEKDVPKRDGVKVGISTRQYLVGKTSLEGIGDCQTYLYINKDYYIKMDTDKGIFVFNLFSKAETEDLYLKLIS